MKRHTLFAKRLNKALADVNLTPYGLSKRIEISPGAMHNFTSGSRVPRTDILIKICRELSLSADFLLGLSP